MLSEHKYNYINAFRAIDVSDNNWPSQLASVYCGNKAISKLKGKMRFFIFVYFNIVTTREYREN